MRRLLDVVGESSVGVDFQHTEVDLHLSFISRDRHRRVVRFVEHRQAIEIERRQQVAVHHQKRLVGAGQQPETAGRVERRRLAKVIDAEAVALAVAQEGADQLGQVPGNDRQVGDAEQLQLADEDLDHRRVVERHERLRKRRGERLQPRPFSPGQ